MALVSLCRILWSFQGQQSKQQTDPECLEPHWLPRVEELLSRSDASLPPPKHMAGPQPSVHVSQLELLEFIHLIVHINYFVNSAIV